MDNTTRSGADLFPVFCFGNSDLNASSIKNSSESNRFPISKIEEKWYYAYKIWCPGKLSQNHL